MQEPDKNTDIEAVRQQAAEGGLRFEAYLPPRLAEWVIALVDQDVFHSPAEAVFVAMQSFRDLDEHPDLKQELLKRAIQKGIDSAKKGEGIPAEKVMERLRQEMARPRPDPAVWDKSLDKPLFPEDGSE